MLCPEAGEGLIGSPGQTIWLHQYCYSLCLSYIWVGQRSSQKRSIIIILPILQSTYCDGIVMYAMPIMYLWLAGVTWLVPLPLWVGSGRDTTFNKQPWMWHDPPYDSVHAPWAHHAIAGGQQRVYGLGVTGEAIGDVTPQTPAEQHQASLPISAHHLPLTLSSCAFWEKRFVPCVVYIL